MCSRTSIRSLPGRGRRRRSPTLSWSRWRSVRRRWGFCSDRQFLGLVAWRLPGWFPYLPCQSQYNRRLRGLTGLLTVVQQRLARLLDAGGVRLADGTLIGVANYAGCAARSEFAGVAAYGFCAAKSEWVWGVRLVLRADRRGLPLGFTLVPANEHEYEPLLDLVDPGETVIGDKGLWGRTYNQRMACAEVELLTPARERTRPRRAAADDRERLLEPERTDAARAASREDTARARATDRPAATRAHPRHPAQHPQRPPRPRPRRLRRPLTHIKPLGRAMLRARRRDRAPAGALPHIRPAEPRRKGLAGERWVPPRRNQRFWSASSPMARAIPRRRSSFRSWSPERSST